MYQKYRSALISVLVIFNVIVKAGGYSLLPQGWVVPYNGKTCVVKYDGSPGVCTPFQSCLPAITLLHQKNIWPDICSFDGYGSPIVCCSLDRKMSKISTITDLNLPKVSASPPTTKNCVSSHHGKSGTCVPLASCRPALLLLKQNLTVPDVCGFTGLELFVCCVQETAEVREGEGQKFKDSKPPSSPALSIPTSETCSRKHDGKAGICMPFSSCLSTIALLHKSGIQPTICSVNPKDPIVCCVQSEEPSKGYKNVRVDGIPARQLKMLQITDIVPPNSSISSASIGNPCNIKQDGSAGIWRKYLVCYQKKIFLDKTRIGILKNLIICCPLTRVSERKCEEYGKDLIKMVNELSMNVTGRPMRSAAGVCAAQLIVGGETTQIGEFPHMAVLGWIQPSKTVKWMCGGSLISDKFVLTAAHCTTENGDAPDFVRLGEQNLQSADDGAHPEDYPIADILCHPNYRPPTLYNDIALLKLSRRVNFNLFIRPTCLWQDETFNTKTAIITGWGRTNNAGSKTDELLKAIINLIDNKTCRSIYQKFRGLENGIEDTQMCAGQLRYGKDTCDGDSGGPLQIIRSKTCMYYLIGVTSFGHRYCGSSPGVYSRVNKFVDWIEEVVWPDQ